MKLVNLFPLSKNKMEVLLEIYLMGEDYLRSLAKKTEINLSLIHRIIKSLREAGIIITQKRGQEYYYSIAPEEKASLGPFLENYHKDKTISKYPELKVLIRLISGNKELLDSCQKIYLFGSFVTGNITSQSDIDLLFITQNKKLVLDWCREVSITLGRTISPLIYTSQKFREELKKKEPLLSSIVQNKKNRLILIGK